MSEISLKTIIIGVTIGGIYMYVGQSRVNTDINNDSSITSVVGTLNGNEDVYKWASGSTTAATISVPKTGMTNANIAVSGISDNTTKANIVKAIQSLFPDGFPSSKTNHDYTITLTPDGKGSISVNCNLGELANGSTSSTPASGSESGGGSNG